MEKQQKQAVADADDADMGGRLEKGASLRKKGKALGKQSAGPQGDSQAEYWFNDGLPDVGGKGERPA